MKPVRVQLSRKKGWRMPANTVKVCRPGKFGNPFKVVGVNEHLFCDASHRRKILTPWVIFNQDQDIVNDPATVKMAVEHFGWWLTGVFNAANIVRPCLITREDILSLRGKNLACWCKIGTPCHADVLLEIANK